MSKIFTPLGASNHTKQEREKHDFYATSPDAIRLLMDRGGGKTSEGNLRACVRQRLPIRDTKIGL